MRPHGEKVGVAIRAASGPRCASGEGRCRGERCRPAWRLKEGGARREVEGVEKRDVEVEGVGVPYVRDRRDRARLTQRYGWPRL